MDASIFAALDCTEARRDLDTSTFPALGYTEARRDMDTSRLAALAHLRSGQVTDIKYNQTVEADTESISTPEKFDLNPTVTDWIKYLTNDKEYMFSKLNCVSSKNTGLNKALNKDKEMAPLLPSILHTCTDNCNSCQDKLTAVPPATTSTTDNENSKSRELPCKKCHILAGNCQNSLIFAKGDNRKRRVTFSDERKRCCCDDQGLFGVPDTKVTESDSFQTGVFEASKNCLAVSKTCNFNNSDVGEEDAKPCPVQCTRGSLSSQVLGHQSTKAITTDIIKSVSTTPNSSVTRVPVHGVILPLDNVAKEKPRMFVVIPLFGQKEKLSRRQLLQLVGMMALGFIFVIVIIVWIFSPALF